MKLNSRRQTRSDDVTSEQVGAIVETDGSSQAIQ